MRVFGLSCFELYNSKLITKNSKNMEPIEFRVVSSSFWVMFSGENWKLSIIFQLDFGPINRVFGAWFFQFDVAEFHMAFTWNSSLRDSSST